MKVAALYDIHGNLPALEAVLEEVGEAEVDEIVVGGDVVLGPMPRECLDVLLNISIPVNFIKGNCEVSVLNAMRNAPPEKLPPNVMEDILWTGRQLLPSHEQIISKWPKTISFEINGLGKMLFCHGTPENENEIFTKLTSGERLESIFENIKTDLVVCGHTHMQFDRGIGNVRVINAGSIGMPFGKPGAYWLLLDTTVQFRCTKYNLEQAVERIKNTSYPHAKDFAEKSVLKPPTEETMLAIFSKAEKK